MTNPPPRDDLDVELLRKLLTYDPETGKLTWLARPREMFTNDGYRVAWCKKYAGKEAGSLAWDGYRNVGIFTTRYRAHRLAWALHFGRWPAQGLDHINGDRADNRIANLREATQSENQRNRCLPKGHKSGVYGVRWDGKKWEAFIKGNEGRNKYLGWFDDFDAAVAARRQAERELGYHENHGRAAA
jgi:hypothetical protein